MNCLLYYFSSYIGNTEKLVNKLLKLNENLTVKRIDENNYKNKVKDQFIIIFPTCGKGEAPEQVLSFMELNHKLCIGIVGTGQLTFGKQYALGAVKVSELYKLPLLMKVELSGSPDEVEKLNSCLNLMLSQALKK